MTKTVAIFGSTGTTGQCVTETALRKGYKVQVLVREPGRLPDNLRTQIGLVQGDILSYADVLATVKDVDAVIVALGTRNDLKPTTDLSEGLKNIIQAMEASKVEPISVCLSAFLFFDIDSGRVPDKMKDITAEHQRMYDLLKASSLKYVAVFSPHIADEPATGYLVENEKYISRKVSKYDLAEFMVDSLDLTLHHRTFVGIASKSA
ncbi:hypothetical protein GWI33_006301 [Rhynchophorus ferrugineus]|uniref:NAD(P)-binding domain-containing protein n=1 Tax=Rhynchophorus ferrugineus TaxID=354439 RepID=A0A834MD54_RHYFE|nr:hypothetical protein GWI33_006301 [Rhynchophorus ferrugineus]